jgi:hypothetical protein
MRVSKRQPTRHPFSTKVRSCLVCNGVTFYLREDGVPLCPRHLQSKKQPTRGKS